ncbi:MAG: hypothetical protein AVDCRST_MAG25-2119, partial [uncultured Rubrobacteraceae bacterium]
AEEGAHQRGMAGGAATPAARRGARGAACPARARPGGSAALPARRLPGGGRGLRPGGAHEGPRQPRILPGREPLYHLGPEDLRQGGPHGAEAPALARRVAGRGPRAARADRQPQGRVRRRGANPRGDFDACGRAGPGTEVHRPGVDGQTARGHDGGNVRRYASRGGGPAHGHQQGRPLQAHARRPEAAQETHGGRGTLPGRIARSVGEGV